MASLDTMEASTSLPPAFAWSHAYSFATSVANFFAMPALPDAADVSSDADDNETLGTAAGVATGAAGATTVNDRPGPRRWGTVARIVWPDDGTLTSNCDPGGLSSGHVTLRASGFFFVNRRRFLAEAVLNVFIVVLQLLPLRFIDGWAI